jgi:ribonuclease HI
MQVLEKLSKLKKVTLVWIPGHQGIPGNQEADRLAKEGAIKVSPNQYTTTPFSEGKKTHHEATGTEASEQVG